ncbi:apolipoprotein N-acyltransferase [Schaalia vaccimaxillae]|uniref:apolipoprotein N-acyltransferase n=1 Tax=Schaalia vaccimaxillae TaxID=183916 RepID=UPI001FB04FE0|nr:apolipoprotein N-acyltransferase [Schaalia vaccimaxillae]
MTGSSRSRGRLGGFIDVVVCALAGLAMWCAFPDAGLWWLVVPSLALFFSRIDTVGWGRSLLYTIVFATCFWLPLIDWVVLATGGWLPWIALTASQVFFYAVWVLCVKLIEVWHWTMSVLGQSVIYGITWVGIEQLRSSFPWSGFPWGAVHLPQVDSPLGHLAPYGGETLVGGVVVVVAVLVRRTFSLRQVHDVTSWWGRPAMLGLACALFVAPLAIPLPSSQEAGSLRLALVQGDVRLPGAQAFSREGEVTANNAQVTAEVAGAGESVDLVIWGETAADRDPRESQLVADLVSRSSKKLDAPILLGFANVKDDLRWNWIGTWYPGEGLDESNLYAKQKPVPFGEFIPWRSLVSRLATEAAQVNLDMAPADNPGYMEIRTASGRQVPLAVGICFEAAYASIFREGVTMGGQMIVTPSNNYHFLDSAQTAQQGQTLRFRSMEFSRSSVQASTTGRSYVIRPDGQIQAMTQPQSAEYLVAQVPLRTSLTLTTQMGHWPGLAVQCATALLVVCAMTWRALKAALKFVQSKK